MADPYIGEIKMFAGNFAPRGWALCDGQLLNISQYDALYSLLGTTYGGDGRTTFGLPDLRGRVPIHVGTGPGLTPRTQGQRGGAETVPVTLPQLPSHAHGSASMNAASESSPEGNLLGYTSSTHIYRGGDPGPYSMQAGSIGSVGGNQPHTNLMPSLCVNFIIALTGVYPSRN
jgi:microcystin-dependent protein